MKMWAGRLSGDVDEGLNRLNQSIGFDSRMFEEDIQGSMAHATMLGAVGVLEVQPSSLNPMGIVHGGALVTLADTVCGTAAFTTGHMCVTLDCSMQYLAPASGARITCTATPRKLGKTVLVYEAVLTDDTGRTVATGVYTFFAKGPAN